MDDAARLTFLTRYYYDLQGVRFAPLWIAGLLLLFAWMPHYANCNCIGWGAVCCALGGVLAIQALWYWMANGYYRRRFGCLKPHPYLFAKPKPHGPFWWACLLSIVVWAIYCRVHHTAAFIPFMLAFFLTQPVYNAENPPIRRIHYGVGAGLIAASAMLSWIARSDGVIYFVTLCIVMLALGIADHLLLLGLLTPAREDGDA
jgi:hypothetical protein